MNLKALADGTEIKDGERLPVAVKDMGACEIYPQTIAHNPNGRFVVVCGDGEYIIYTSMALRNKAFGSAQEFVWALESNEYAIRENNGTVRLFRNFKERKSFTPDLGAESIYGGYLFGVRTSSSLVFYDWETLTLVRRIEVQPRHVFWNESGSLVCLATEESFFILSVDTGAISVALEAKQDLEDDIETAFDVLGKRKNWSNSIEMRFKIFCFFSGEINEVVKTGLWVGDCFIYTNSVNRINYYVGGEIVTISHLDRTMYLLGYVPKDNRLYLGDKELNVISFSLQLSVLEYQTAVMRRDFERADLVLPTIPKEHRTRVAHFLEKQGFKSQALQVSTDPDHKFDLALQISELDVAVKLAREAENPQKWAQLADVASRKNNMALVKECMEKANDFSGLLLLATASGDAEMLKNLGDNGSAQGRHNIAFLSAFIRSDVNRCLEILIETNRLPEAAFFARTYIPSQMSRIVELWREELSKFNEKAGQSLADPAKYENLFPGLGDALQVEEFLKQKESQQLPANAAASLPLNIERNPLEEMHLAQQKGIYESNAKVDIQDYKKSDDYAATVSSSATLATTTAASATTQPASIKEDDDDDDLDLEIEGITLDDNIDTTDVNLDDDFLSDD